MDKKQQNKAPNALLSIVKRLQFGMVEFFRGIPSKRAEICLAIAVPLLVVLWHLCVASLQSAHLNEIVAELTPSRNFHFDPMPDNAGDRVVFIQNTSGHGYGVYFAHVPGKERKLIYEQPFGKTFGISESVLGWSPDDKLFAYCRKNEGQWEIVICDGESGETIATTAVDKQVSIGAWISPQTLVFSEYNVLFSVTLSQKKWLKAQPFGCFGDSRHKIPKDPIPGLAALDATSIIWQQGNAIFTCLGNSIAPTKLWESRRDKLLEFAYSQTAERLLLHCQNSSGQFLVEYSPYLNNSSSNFTTIDTNEYNPSRLAFINGGTGYVFLSQIGNMFQVATNWNTMVIKPDDSHDFIKYQWPDQIAGFSARNQKVFVETSLDNGPMGICVYDLASGSAECVVPYTDVHFPYQTDSEIERGSATNASGEMLTYYLYKPPHSDNKGKCPLIMGILGRGPPGFSWGAIQEAFADSGYYYAYVERYNRPFSSDQWADDVLTVYQSLAIRPGIDTNCVYLFGVSAGAPSVYELMQGRPDLWRGAVLISPGDLPDPSQFTGKRFLVDLGGSDEGPEIPTRFLDEAAKDSTPVTLLMHPGFGHVFNSSSIERERMREALIFLNEP